MLSQPILSLLMPWPSASWKGVHRSLLLMHLGLRLESQEPLNRFRCSTRYVYAGLVSSLNAPQYGMSNLLLI